MIETPETIAQWSCKQFPKLTEESQWNKLLEELKEYENAKTLEDAIKEYADLFIVACILDVRFNNSFAFVILGEIDKNDHIAKLIDVAVEEKMKINRSRVWEFKNGVYHHKEVKDE